MQKMVQSQNLNFLKTLVEFEFLVGFNTEEEDQFKQLLARLNSIDNAIQSHLESEMQQPIPQYAKDLGYTQKRWEKTFYFHPWILSGEENPPNLRYVADYVNDEFTVYFAKNMADGKHTGMQSAKSNRRKLARIFLESNCYHRKSKYHGIIG